MPLWRVSLISNGVLLAVTVIRADNHAHAMGYAYGLLYGEEDDMNDDYELILSTELLLEAFQ